MTRPDAGAAVSVTPPRRGAAAGVLARLWPRRLSARLALIVCSTLLLAHLLTLAWLQFGRADLARSMMVGYLGRDIASAVAVLDRLPPGERAAWLPRLARAHYRYELRPPARLQADPSARAALIGATLAAELEAAPGLEGRGPRLTGLWRVADRAAPAGTGQDALELGLELADGRPLAVIVNPPQAGLPVSVALLVLAQLLVLAGACWFVVRLAARPLARMADAADAFATDLRPAPLPLDGPDEVARAAVAFNALQARIESHVAERTRMLAAIAHDLRTPLARMRLRCELLPASELSEKLQADLVEMQGLIEQGLAYAGCALETGTRREVDLAALLDSIVADYQDTGAAVSGPLPACSAALRLRTCPQALRRLLGNLIDNALKFAGAAELACRAGPEGLRIDVADRGPGIPEDHLDAVLQPYVRLEISRNRDSGGAGLGLAIAHALAQALGGELRLSNREGGGLVASLHLPASAWAGSVPGR